MPITYPVDLSGNDPNNKIIDEVHTVSESHYRDFFFIVPNFAPFYVDNFSATITINNTTRTLVEDVDFSFGLQYITGTRVTGKPLYGAITLHNLDTSGILKITYQTLGGEHVINRLQVLTYLVEKAYNPRTTIWDLITDTPVAFPPTPHYQDYDEFYGQEELIAKLNEIKDAILQNASLNATQLTDFINNFSSTAIGNYVLKSGDTMTGYLNLHDNPVNSLHAATKQYVDNNINLTTINFNNELLNKVSKAGDSMTGYLNLHANPTDALHAATKQYVDNIQNTLNTLINNKVSRNGDTMTGALTLSGDPINNLHAATKQYVDNKIEEVKAMINELTLLVFKKF